MRFERTGRARKRGIYITRRFPRQLPHAEDDDAFTVAVKLAAGSLDSHLGGARTLILPGRIGPATRESAWKKSASESSPDGPAFR